MSPDAQSSEVDHARKVAKRRGRSSERALVAAALLTLGLAAESCSAFQDPALHGTSRPSAAGDGTTAEAARGLVIIQTSAVTSLAPGHPAQQLRGTITNPHYWPVYVSSISARVSGTNRLECPATSFTIAGSPAEVTALLAPGPRSRSWSGITVGFAKTTTNQDACKNTTVHIAYSIP